MNAFRASIQSDVSRTGTCPGLDGQPFPVRDCLSHRQSIPMAPRRDLLPGTLDMLILKTLSAGPLHGYGIALHVRESSRDALQIDEGSLYPALQRMRQKGWIKAEWKRTPNNQ